MANLDLVALWEEHCRREFETRDANATMATMVPQPYVNHIPTMTGGVGHGQLKRGSLPSNGLMTRWRESDGKPV